METRLTPPPVVLSLAVLAMTAIMAVLMRSDGGGGVSVPVGPAVPDTAPATAPTTAPDLIEVVSHPGNQS